MINCWLGKFRDYKYQTMDNVTAGAFLTLLNLTQPNMFMKKNYFLQNFTCGIFETTEKKCVDGFFVVIQLILHKTVSLLS